MIHNFKKSLQFEREQTEKADNFYRNILKVSDIKRFNSDSEEDMIYQKQDIDVILTLNGKDYKISEKFRIKDFGDLYVEVYSKYPHTMGWMNSGSPDAIMYFTPDNAYWIGHKTLKEFYINKLFPVLKLEWFEDLYNSGQTLVKKKIVLDKNISNISLIQAHNKDGKEWKTMGVSVPFNILEKYGVKIKRFILQ
jgi:hypothetical protein